jgi:hypothetical protein
MTTHTKRASLVVTVLLVFTVYRVMSDVTVTGAGGLGGVSAGVFLAIFDFVWISAFVYLFFWLRHRLAAKAQPQSPAPRP